MIVVIATEFPDKVALAVAKHYPDRHWSVSGSTWIVATRATALEVAGRVGIADGENGSGLAIEISRYWGRAPKDLWPWISENWDR